MNHRRAVTGLALSVALSGQSILVIPCEAASSSKDKSRPTGTLLLPLSPKMDDAGNSSGPPVVHQWKAPISPSMPTNKAAPAPKTASAPAKPAAANRTAAPVRAVAPKAVPASNAAAQAINEYAPPQAPIVDAESAPASKIIPGSSSYTTAAEGTEADLDAPIDEESLLKGTVQIVADDTEYDQEKNTFLGTGNAIAIIGGQNSKLEADTILYDQNSQTIDARGNVKILRNGSLTTGSSFKFKVNSDEYLITHPDTELQGTTVVARIAKGDREGLAFKNGSFTLPEPVHIMSNSRYGPQSAAERAMDAQIHPDAYLPAKQSFKFSARKMVYERYKESGNLTVFGGRMKFKNFTLPVPKFQGTVGQANQRVIFPVTPIIGNNLMVGGVNMGPSFNYAVGKTGSFSWAPLVQIGGGNTTTATGMNKIGAGFRLGVTTDRITSHLAYGSVSNLLVGDFKAGLGKNTLFQSGINRFLSDGLMGNRRARFLAEVVDTRNVSSIPFVQILQFRTSGGYAQDLPSLVNLSGQNYAQLFNTTGKSKIGAYRLQEQIFFNSQPIFSVGDNKYGANMSLFGGTALRAYSTGDKMVMGQLGPILNIRLNKVRFQSGYTQSGVRGQSPFVFDQFVQGDRSTFLNGDVKLAKWLTLGGTLGYSLDRRMMYSRGLTAAIGPEDFKVLLSRDTISGINRFGFDLLYGAPVQFNKLVVKGNADAGQLGGI